MRRSEFTPIQTSLRPYLAVSMVAHVVLFTLITIGILSERRSVEDQEALFITDVLEQERRLEEQEKKAREEATQDLLGEQAMAEMEQLVADQLEESDEDKLLELTEEGVDKQLAEWDHTIDLDALLNEEFYELSDQLRNETFEDMRGHLKQMKQDLLLSQVRAYIRNRVAPEIKQRIDSKLKHELGQRIKDEAVRQSHAEKIARVGDPIKELQAVIRELAAVKGQQDRVTSHVQGRRHNDAAAQQDQVRDKQQANAGKVDAVLGKVEGAVPALADRARALRDSSAAGDISPAVTVARAAIEKARQSHQDAGKIDRKTQPEPAKAAQTVADKDKADAETRSQKASERIAARHSELQELSKSLTGEQQRREPDDLQRRVVEAAAEEVEQAVRDKVEKEVAETAIPIAADRIVKALEPDLKKRNLNDEKFRGFLEKDIKRALEEEMKRQKSEPKVALMKTEQHFELQDRKSLDEAQRDVAEVARKLKELAARQEKFRDEVPVDTPSRDAMKQHMMADDVRTTREKAAGVLNEARTATLMHDAGVAEAERQVKDPAAEKTASNAARAMEREVVSDAKKMMTEVGQKLRASAAAMEKLAQDLAKEAEAVRERAVRHVDLKKALGKETAGQAVAKVKEGADRIIEQSVKPEVSWAARTVDTTGILGQEAAAEALAKMAELESRLDQIAENIAQGRGLADYLGMGMGMLGPGRGLGPGGLPSLENLPWTLPYGRRMSRINLKAYEEFVKDMRDRLNPDNYYSEEEATDEVATVAEPSDKGSPAVIFIEELPAKREVARTEKRIVPKPDFPTLEFGAAAMMEKPPLIDGDLSDWGELRHGLKLRYRGNSLEKVTEGPTVYVRWSPDGLYFAYTVTDPNGIQPCPEHSWSGDGMEIMIDMANSRRPEAYLNVDSQKFSLTPFGCKGKETLTIWEMGRGLRGLGMAGDYPDIEGIKGKSAAKILPGKAYSVEGFISRRALAKPLLVPGKYVGLNFSLNQSTEEAGYQWSSSQQLQTWRRPDTWGDLLLLGSDAKLKFVKDAESDEEAKGIVPHDVMCVEVADADMNINTRKVDRVPAELVVKDGASRLFIVLRETGANTGVFRASVNTQPYFMEPNENALNVQSGEIVQLVYTDARAEYGEKNRKVLAELAVGWPVMKLRSN